MSYALFSGILLGATLAALAVPYMLWTACHCQARLARNRKRAGDVVPVCPRCGTSGCLEDKALDW